MHFVALGRWREVKDAVWVLLSLSTLGSKEEDLPSSPAHARGSLDDLRQVA